jgi:hypothetical protein
LAIEQVPNEHVNNNTISVFLGNLDGTYSLSLQSPIAVNTCLFDPLCNGVPISIAVGKFNLKNNQHLGIADRNIPINTACLASATAQNLPAQDVCSGGAVLTGNGDGTFTGSNLPFYSNNFDTGGHLPTSVAVGDSNNDGYPDLAIVNLDSGNVSILTGKGDGSFNSPSTISVGSRPTSVAVGDFNADHILDLAIANGKVSRNCGPIANCTRLLDFDDSNDYSEATKYYCSIGVDPAHCASGAPRHYTFSQWKMDYGFPSAGFPPAHAFYFNIGDLKLGGDMNCVQNGQNGQNVACYVSNYGSPPFDLTPGKENTL